MYNATEASRRLRQGSSPAGVYMAQRRWRARTAPAPLLTILVVCTITAALVSDRTRGAPAWRGGYAPPRP